MESIMAEKAWYGDRSRKQRGYVLSPQRKWVAGQRMQRDQEPLKPTLSNISFSKVPPPKKIHSFPTQYHYQGTKSSDIWANGGHFSFKSLFHTSMWHWVSFPITHINRHGRHGNPPTILALWGLRQENSIASWSGRLAEFVSSRSAWRTLPQHIRWVERNGIRHLITTSGLNTHLNTCMSTHMLIPIWICLHTTHTQTQAKKPCIFRDTLKLIHQLAQFSGICLQVVIWWWAP